MAAFYVLLALATIVAVALYYPKLRRRVIVGKDFPPEWQSIVESRLPFVCKLDPHLQAQLQNRIKLFLARMKFYGCNGLQISDEIRVTIAAEACLLLLIPEFVPDEYDALLLRPQKKLLRGILND